MKTTYLETNRAHRKTSPNRYTLALVFALALTCGIAQAQDDGVVYGPKLTDAQYDALRAAVSKPEPEGFVGSRRQSANMTADGVVVSTDSLEPGTVSIAYVPGANPVPLSDVVNNQATQAAIANITQMNLDLATMKRDQQIISAAIAKDVKPDQEFREAFEKAEQAAIVAAQQPAQARIAEPKAPPVIYETRKPLVSFEKKETE